MNSHPTVRRRPRQAASLLTGATMPPTTILVGDGGHPATAARTEADYMTTRTARPGGKRHFARVLAFVASVVVALGLMAVPAQALQKCSGAPAINLCVWIDREASGLYRVHVGIDVHMTQAQAKILIDLPGDPFRAEIWKSDPSPLNEGVVFSPIPMLSVSASDLSGLSADFEVLVDRAVLNEDKGPWPLDEEDDIFIKVFLLPTGQEFRSAMYNQRF